MCSCCSPLLLCLLQAAQQREQVLAAKRVKRAAKRHLDAVQQLLQDPEQEDQQPVPGATGWPAQSPEDKAAKAQLREQRRVEQAQRLVQEAEEKAQQQQKRAEALARLQASTASSQPVLQRPGLVRPLARPPPPPPVQPPQS